MTKKQNITDSLERSFKIKIPYIDVQTKMEEDFQQLSKTLKVAGFRPGKIPLSYVKNKYLKQVLTNVSEKLIREEGNKKFDKGGYRIASQPKVNLLSEFKENIDLEAEFIFEILPDFELFDFKNIQLENYISKVEENDINNVVKKLYFDYREFEKLKVSRKSKKDDRLIISFKGYIDNKVFEGGSAEKQTFDIGQNNYLPEFEKNLIGKTINEEVVIDLTFPMSYQKKDLQGKKARFVVIIEEIFEPKILKDENELAKKIGVKDKKELKEKIQKELEKYSKDISFSIIKSSIIKTLDSNHDFFLPKTLVENENAIILNYQQLPKDLNESEKKKNLIKIKEEAEKKVKIGLIISEIGVKNKITVNNQELENEIAKICMQNPGREKEIIEYYKKNSDKMNSLKGPIFENKVIQFIIENAKVKDIMVTSEELNKKVNSIEQKVSKNKK